MSLHLGSLAEEMLRYILGYSATMYRNVTEPHKMTMSYLAMLEDRRFRNKHATMQAIRRLQKAGYIRARQRGADLTFALTSSGETQALVSRLRRQPKRRLADGKVCLVIYDFPEVARNARDAFRYLLKILKFTKVQGSVWECRYDVARHIRYFVQLNKADDWIMVFVAKEVE